MKLTLSLTVFIVLLTLGVHAAPAWTVSWGTAGDVPVSGDYDGDARIDIAVYRPSTGVWYILTSSSDYTQFWTVSWGAPGDVPVPGAYGDEHDTQTQLAVFRPSTGQWLIRESLPARIKCDFARPECYVEKP